MKKLITLSLIIISLFGCKPNSSNEKSSSSSSSKTELEKKITARNYFINSSNSYSDLFFDSTAMEKYFVDAHTPDSLIRRMRSFYNNRNYQMAWFASNGVTEQGRGFYNMFKYYDKTDTSIVAKKELTQNMNRYVNAESLSVSSNDKSILQTELMMTEQFIDYMLGSVEDGFIKRKEMERFVPYQKSNALELADSLVNKEHKDGKYYGDFNKAYGAMLQKLKQYVAIAKSGGFVQVSSAKDIPALKKRLIQSGDLDASDTSLIETPNLTQAINQFQTRFGYTPSGSLSAQQLKEMNVPVEKRIEQMLVNLGRMQWRIETPTDRLIMVNIPEFVLHAMENGKEAWKMKVVVGKEGHNTMTFTGNLSTVAFSPYWNVPPSIVEKEILPAMSKNPNYLASHNMEIVSEGNPPTIRQKPGPDNSLGRVKFLFPNSFNIYFHDTNAKALFDKDKRAFSHGCIRLSDPVKMANYVLRDMPEWSPQKINEAMNQTTETQVKVKSPIFVLITYYTSWVDENGLLHFADDIYDHDQSVAKKMFNNSSYSNQFAKKEESKK